jgi:2-iminobutanoate/2-iminopropanoate deaminase
MADKETVSTDAAPGPYQGAPYSQAIKANGFVFVAGQVGAQTEGRGIAGDTVASQTEQVFDNIEAILKAAGSGLERVVKTTVFLTNLDDFAGMNEVYARRIREPYPARSTVEVSALPSGVLVEIEAIALG